MNRPLLQKNLLLVLAWGAVMALSSAVVLAQDSAAAQPSDGQIEMDVVHALDAAPQLKNDLITAATIQAEVTLSGTVSTEDSRKQAESIATKVNGVAPSLENKSG